MCQTRRNFEVEKYFLTLFSFTLNDQFRARFCIDQQCEQFTVKQANKVKCIVYGEFTGRKSVLEIYKSVAAHFVDFI